MGRVLCFLRKHESNILYNNENMEELPHLKTSETELYSDSESIVVIEDPNNQAIISLLPRSPMQRNQSPSSSGLNTLGRHSPLPQRSNKSAIKVDSLQSLPSPHRSKASGVINLCGEAEVQTEIIHSTNLQGNPDIRNTTSSKRFLNEDIADTDSDSDFENSKEKSLSSPSRRRTSKRLSVGETMQQILFLRTKGSIQASIASQVYFGRLKFNKLKEKSVVYLNSASFAISNSSNGKYPTSTSECENNSFESLVLNKTLIKKIYHGKIDSGMSFVAIHCQPNGVFNKYSKYFDPTRSEPMKYILLLFQGVEIEEFISLVQIHQLSSLLQEVTHGDDLNKFLIAMYCGLEDTALTESVSSRRNPTRSCTKIQAIRPMDFYGDKEVVSSVIINNGTRNNYGSSGTISHSTFSSSSGSNSQRFSEIIELVDTKDRNGTDWKGQVINLFNREDDDDACIDGDEVILRVQSIRKTDGHGITLTRKDMNRAKPGRFLNDNLLDLALGREYERCLTESSDNAIGSRFHLFSALFMTQLAHLVSKYDIRTNGMALQGIAKWTKGVDLFSKDLVIIPINDCDHWSLMVVAHLSSIIHNNTSNINMTSNEHKSNDSKYGVGFEDNNDNIDNEEKIPMIFAMDSLNLHDIEKFGNLIKIYLGKELLLRKRGEVDLDQILPCIRDIPVQRLEVRVSDMGVVMIA